MYIYISNNNIILIIVTFYTDLSDDINIYSNPVNIDYNNTKYFNLLNIIH